MSEHDSEETAAAGPPRLVVEGVRKEFSLPSGKLEILKGVSLTMAAGESASIVGPSGSGKSTLLNIIGSLDRPSAGTVSVDGVDVTSLADDALAAYRARQVGFIFQDHHLLPQCTAIENVMLPTLTAGSTGAGGHSAAAALLERMGLTDRAASFPAQLSGGERQRVAVARALINSPGLLLCDEPTGSLDGAAAETVAGLLAELVEENSLCLVVVTHNMELAGRFGRMLRLDGGVLTEGPA